jgi:hypothetical protein
MKTAPFLRAGILWLALGSPVLATTYGSVEPIATPDVIDTGILRAQRLDVRAAFAGLLDAVNTGSFDFPANYVVLNFETPPPLRTSAALFEAVGRIDPELFATDSSGFTQYGRAYLSLQSFVPDSQFIAGYVQAAAEFGVEYTPIVAGVPSLFTGGAAFPGNNWILFPGGEEYLARIPAENHQALMRLRAAHLRFTRQALRELTNEDDGNSRGQGIRHQIAQLRCP